MSHDLPPLPVHGVDVRLVMRAALVAQRHAHGDSRSVTDAEIDVAIESDKVLTKYRIPHRPAVVVAIQSEIERWRRINKDKEPTVILLYGDHHHRLTVSEHPFLVKSPFTHEGHVRYRYIGTPIRCAVKGADDDDDVEVL